MKPIIVLGFFVTLSVAVALGQTQQLRIPYSEELPLVDGLPEQRFETLPWNEFQRIEKTNPLNPEVAVRYKVAYNYRELYLLIEANSDTLVYRDRAFQNGDGFHMVIAKPEKDTTSSEFYVLQFAPANKTKNTAARKAVWYYNIGLSGKTLSSATQLVCQEYLGKTYFELQLPWSDVHPYHPLFSEEIGFNLCFVKAIGTKDKNYYFIKYDKRIQSEQSRREFINVEFETPVNCNVPYSQVKLDRNNIETGKAIKIKTVSLAKTLGPLSYYFAIRSADNHTYSELRKEVQSIEGINKMEFDLSTKGLLPGGYKVCWKCSDSSEGEIPVTVLSEISYAKEKAALDDLKNVLSAGDYNTLLFMVNNLTSDYEKVKSYETAGNIREQYNRYSHCIEQLKNGNNLIYSQNGIFRRAFVSKIDNTLQPYSIRLPEDFSQSKKKYPLFVLLHGSGSDDRNMLNSSLTENKYIEIAPFGRGTSNCFTSDGAEVDVKEAIDDVIRNYPVDTTKIIIAGFSMGGYGAYRIFYEYPNMFKGVAVFSGHPSLANNWFGSGYPDFLEPHYLVPFKNIPVFIYHSKNDLNCPYELTEQLIQKLRNANAKVEVVISQESGHGILDKEHTAQYNDWLKNLIEN